MTVISTTIPGTTTVLTSDAAEKLVVSIVPELADRLVIRHEPAWPAPPGVEAWATRQRDGMGAITFVLPPSVEIALHEAAHVLPSVEPMAVPATTTDGIAFQLEQIDLWLRGDHLSDPTRPPWTGHGPDWLRRLIHLWCRAESAGIAVRQCNFRAVDWADHGIDEYRARLGWETTRCRSWTFAQIEALPMPAYFFDLFKRDQAAWLRQKEPV